MRIVSECQTTSVKSAETNLIDIVVNGDTRTVPAGLNLIDPLVSLGIEPSRVAVELNRSIVRRPEWERTLLTAGSQLEIVQFVGGG
jgi:thiamine biosynthesis protein ThiS